MTTFVFENITDSAHLARERHARRAACEQRGHPSRTRPRHTAHGWVSNCWGCGSLCAEEGQ